jgi:hypothetical protein
MRRAPQVAVQAATMRSTLAAACRIGRLRLVRAVLRLAEAQVCLAPTTASSQPL